MVGSKVGSSIEAPLLERTSPAELKQQQAPGRGTDGKNVASIPGADLAGTDDWTVPAAVKGDDYFWEVKPNPDPSKNEAASIVAAYRGIDAKMRAKNDYHLITTKGHRTIGGTQVDAGRMGILKYAGRPVLALGGSNYWNFSLTHTWKAKNLDMTQVIQELGFTSA